MAEFNHYPIPGCDAWISLPRAGWPEPGVVVVDGNLTLEHLRWLVAEMERLAEPSMTAEELAAWKAAHQPNAEPPPAEAKPHG